MSPLAHRLRNCTLALATALVLFLAVQITTPVHADAAATGSGNFIFILDGSGSMNAQIQGRLKIDVAKEALAGLIKELPEAVRVGLVAYGHRQKGDCSDVEEISPLSPLDKGHLINKIKAIHPKGMTPITHSIRKVAEGLKGLEEETTIVLVSDGLETCKGDPCELVRELKASGIKLVIHVIGFDVTEKEKAQLACVAAAGGGSYYTAGNAGELKAAAMKAVEKKGPQAGTLTVKAVKNGKPLRAFGEVYKNDGEGTGKEKAAESWTDGGSRAFQLPPGTYDLVVESREDPAKPKVNFQGILVEADRNIEKVADFSGGVLTIKALRNGVPSRAYCMVYKPGDSGEKVTEGWTGEPGGFKLPSGTYEATVENREDRNRPSAKIQNIPITAGKTTERVVEFSGGTIVMKALRNNKPFRAFCIIYKADQEDQDKEKAAEGWIEIEGTSFNFTPGNYDIIVENQEDAGKPTVSFQGVAIQAKEAIEKVADFSGGTLKVTASRNGKPFSAFCQVAKAGGDAGGNKEKVAQVWTRNEGALLNLKPGVYDLIVENHEDAGRPVLKFTGITIELGKTVEKVAEFAGGSLKVSAVRNGKPFSAHCAVYAAGEQKEKKSVTTGWTREEGTVFQLLPGAYDIVVENQSDANRPSLEFKGITIEPGKTVEKIAEFSGGTLKVKAARNGKAFSAHCSVYAAGEGNEKKKVTTGWTRVEGAVFQLLPGAYDIVVENQTDATKPKIELTGITIEPGKTEEKLIEFTGGSLQVRAIKNGTPFSAVCHVFQNSDGENKPKELARSWTGDQGAKFELPPGQYSILVEDNKSPGKEKKEIKNATVEVGKNLLVDVQF